jgi:collagenase-like PrtC family protease
MNKKIELLAPAGSMACLKAAVAKKADAVYLGMRQFSARDYATNFNEEYLKVAVKICKSNDVKLYVTMNTLVKNSEIKEFFRQLSYAYSQGIDSVIIQEVSFLDIIQKNYPDLHVHVSTQAGVMNSAHASLLKNADRITLARELTKDEIGAIRKSYPNELEVFCHGALCVSLSGSCLFSSLLGGNSGNRGKCAQVCRKLYNNSYQLSLKELCLVDKIPELIGCGIDSLKIEGRMRTPYYVATVTDIYRKAINSYKEGNFHISDEMKKKLYSAFNREFTQGWFASAKDIFNVKDSSGKSSLLQKENYEVPIKEMHCERQMIKATIPEYVSYSSEKKNLMVRVYSKEDAIAASEAGADIVYTDLQSSYFEKLHINAKLFAVTPRIMLDSDAEEIRELIKEKKPAGLLAGNAGILALNQNLPIHLDYNQNNFNDIDINNCWKNKILPIISPELNMIEMCQMKNKNFAVLVHGKIRLMTLRHEILGGLIEDSIGAKFEVKKIQHGCEILNGKELGLLNKAANLIKSGINNLYIDTDKNVKEIVAFYRMILDGKKADDIKLRKKYILAWAYRGVK